jgi:hypothetical protein
MAKFYGEIGYGESVEVSPGVWEDDLIEKFYHGDVIRNTRRLQEGENLNNDLTVGNSISIVADAYANEHFFAIRYIRWAGTLWTVSDVEVQSPRLTLRLGGVYNGPTFGAPRASGVDSWFA